MIEKWGIHCKCMKLYVSFNPVLWISVTLNPAPALVILCADTEGRSATTISQWVPPPKTTCCPSAGPTTPRRAATTTTSAWLRLTTRSPNLRAQVSDPQCTWARSIRAWRLVYSFLCLKSFRLYSPKIPLDFLTIFLN